LTYQFHRSIYLIKVASRQSSPAKRGDLNSLTAGNRADFAENGRKTMSVKNASELATRLSVPAGAILAATYLVALALTSQVF
jgi:hypothetical protein